MPQFELLTFSSQIFWSLFFFVLLYLSFTYYLVPSVSAILKVRSRKLSHLSSNDVIALGFKNSMFPVNFFSFFQNFVSGNRSLSLSSKSSDIFVLTDIILKDFSMSYSILANEKNKRLSHFYEASFFVKL